MLEPRVCLLRAQTQRGGQTEERREDGADVDDMAPPAPRRARPAAGRRPTGSKAADPCCLGEKRQGQGNDRVDRPGVQRPMIRGGGQCHPARFLDIGGDQVAVGIEGPHRAQGGRRPMACPK